MRLLHSRHLTFRSFFEYESIPKYAILSHTWEEDEVTYKEMSKRPHEAARKKGHQKIKSCAQQALEDGLDYFWIDTCCIDKSSSAELSEAVNSMFHWYRNAHVCYAYLYDISKPSANTNHRLWTAKFQASRWFTRGWTLQELIAPKSLEFYSGDWSHVGTKVDLALAITERTAIPYKIIISGDFSKASLAQRMSWAAGRLTSRREDAAYCLMGIFDVNMPMLYGEGDRAFLRLQEEIITRSDDLSIFSWVSSKATFSTYRGLLARAISDFAQCNDIRWVRGTNNDPYQSTNKGIHISLPLIAREGRPDEYIALLRGVYKKPDMQIGIFLQKVGEEQYAHIESDQLAMPQVRLSGDTSSLVRFYVRQSIIMEAPSHSRVAGISLLFETSVLELLSVQPLTHWDEDTKFFSFEGPIQLRQPPTVIFALRPIGTIGKGITISVNAGNHWGSVLEIDKGWNVSPALTPFVHKVHCRRPQHPVIEVLVERGVFEGDAKLILSVIVLRYEDVPGFSTTTIVEHLY